MRVKLTKVDPSYSVENTTPSYDVSITDTSFDTKYVKATYELSRTIATFQASIVDASYSVSYTNIIPSTIELGLFLLKHSAFDTAAFSEILGFSITKPFADAAQFTEDVSISVDYIRSFSDTWAATDTISFSTTTTRFDAAAFNSGLELVTLDTTKPFSEAPFISDVINSFDTTKGIAEPGTVSDFSSIATVRLNTDAASAAEVIQITNEFYRTKAETPSIADTNTFAIDKYLTESGNYVDITTFATSKQLTELIGVTDDLDGEAVIDDDQTMTFVKVTSDLGSFADSIALQLVWQRALGDAGAFSDSYTFAIGRTLSEAGVVQDAYSRQVDYSRAFQETSVFSDATAFAVTNDIADNGYAAETDVKSINKLRSESATLADSGLLVSQGYVDNNDYFAETYVGTSRTF